MMKIIWGVVAVMLMLPAQAMEWQKLDAMRQAIQEQNYRGEYLHRRGDQSSVYSIVHQYADGESIELLRQLDGDMIEILREDNQVTCYLPKGSESALNHAVPAAPFSQVEALDLQRIARNYDAEMIGTERVAGYMTNIIELSGDDWRYKQRLWLEQESHLLLQSELMDVDGSVLEQFRFTRLELGVPIDRGELIPTLRGQQNVLRQTESMERNASANDGAFVSELDWLPVGYELTHSERKSKGRGWLEQRTYSDGLTSFSVFVEKGEAMDTQQSALAKMGATSALMTIKDGLSVTVIGEIPGKTAKSIAQMLTIPASL